MASLYQAKDIPQTDLAGWRSRHSPIYPTVSLFNLATDPGETENLAEELPGLVEELLGEAELVVAWAPSQVRGDMTHAGAPRGPDEGGLYAVLTTAGTGHSRVTPFGPYLGDGEDLGQLTYEAELFDVNLNMVVIMVKMAAVTLFLPAYVTYKIVRVVQTLKQ